MRKRHEETQRAGVVQPGEEKTRGDLINVYRYLIWGSKEDSTRVLSNIK